MEFKLELKLLLLDSKKHMHVFLKQKDHFKVL